MATINYVKFLRGTPTAYENLATKDDNTLYFISETLSDHGKLYLGSKLILGGEGSGTGVTTLDDLTDVVTSTVGNKQILFYDSESSQWKNGFLSEIIDTICDTLATVKDANGKITLVGFAEAEVGSVPRKNSEGKLEWVALTESYSKAEIDNMLAGRLKRKKVDSLSDIDTDAEDAELYIYLVPSANAQTNNAYDEYIVVNGEIELLNGAPVELDLTDYAKKADLDDYVTLTKYNSEIGSISALEKDEGVTTLVEEVNAINARLKWEDIPGSQE